MDYISRDELRKHLADCMTAELFDSDMKKAVVGIDVYVENMPAADVQPVSQWISVKDRLPDKFDYVLCYCKTTTGEGNEFMFGAYHNDTWWLKTCRTYATLEQPQMRVMYWMPLPKPPKECEVKMDGDVKWQ